MSHTLDGRSPAMISPPCVQIHEADEDLLEPLAVIGFSFKFPQEADTVEGLWDILKERRDVATSWPPDRMNFHAFHPENDNSEAGTFVPGAHFLKEDLSAFDALFFGLNATEAAAMDCQHRILLETTYHALENAGITLEEVSGSKTGVYAGSMADDYQYIVLKDIDNIPKHAVTGVAQCMIANRLSWFYNLHGPSINLDSACSSSLMAFDFACQGLRNRDCDLALVTGSSLVLAAETTLSLNNMNMLSPRGQSFSFDARADGYSRGEGFSVVLVKRLSDALIDGNTIRAVIRSTGSNQDGYTPGATQPSRDLQARLIQETYEKSGLRLDQTRFFEAHGTGTPLGDPIEADAIGSTFRKVRSKSDPLYIGAVKSNIGHLEGGSGLAGIIKTILVLEKGIIPPNANFDSVNPNIDAKFLNIKFPTECMLWPSSGLRRASVASFGFGGSNSHVILDDALHYLRQRSLTGNHNTSALKETQHNGVECNGQNFHNHNGSGTMHTIESLPGQLPESCSRAGAVTLRLTGGVGGARDEGALETTRTEEKSYPECARLLVFSAADESGIKRLAGAYEDHYRNHKVSEDEEIYLDRLAHTLATRRTLMAWRSFAVLKSAGSLEQLDSLMSKPLSLAAKQGATAFIFTGQGAQYRRMGVQLFKHPVFKRSIEEFDGELHDLGCSWSVAGLLREDGPVEHDLDDPEYSQPTTTALQIALYEFMCALNAIPAVVLGHSSGEIAAAFAAGALSLRSACRVSLERGRLASALKRSAILPGAMLSVDLSEEEIRALMVEHSPYRGSLCVACINSPCNVTVSGNESEIDALQEHLQRQNIRSRKLATGVAYHSPHMSSIAAEYGKSLAGLTFPAQSATRPSMISSVTGQYTLNLSEVCKPSYWVANLVSPVQFVKAMSVISQSVGKAQTRKLGAAKAVRDIRDFVEIGPHSALRRPVLDNLAHHKVPDAKERYHTILLRQVPACQSALQLIGELFVRGYPVSVQGANLIGMTSPSNPQLLIDLPSYPFNHSKSYWHEPTIGQHARVRRAPKQELLGVPVSDWNPLEPRWRKFLDVSETPWKGEHIVNGKAIYPATGMVVMAIEAAKQVADPSRQISGYRIQDAVFSAPIPVEEDRSEVQLHMRSDHTHPIDKSTTSFEFRVYCMSTTGWFENCHGFVQVVYENDRSDDQDIRRRENSFFCEKFNEAQKLCIHHVPTKQMYENFITNGLMYGPAFQGLDNLYWDGGDVAIGDVRCFRWTAEQSHNARQTHVAHPTTLDAAGQLAWVVLTEGAAKSLANGFAATRIQYMWLANSGLSYPETDHIRVWNKSVLTGLRGTDCSVFALNEIGELVMQISHFETTTVGGSDTAAKVEHPRDICYDMVYRPDVSLMDAAQLSFATTLGSTVDETESPTTRFYLDLEATLFYLAKKTRDATRSLDPSQMLTKPHMKRYVDWLDRQITRYEIGNLTWRRQGWIHDVDDSSEMETLINNLEATSEKGQLFMRVGRALVNIVQGFQDPLAVIFDSGLAERYYQELCDDMLCSKQVTRYLGLLSHKNPHMSVLEVGAGTGSITGCIIEGLERRFNQYVYTDISQAYFEAAKEKFASFQSNMVFQLLDVERDAVEQGYEAESYDLVVAAWVLHATRDLASTVHHVRKLLKPHGKLLLLEITEPEILRNGFVFGTLPGWWSGLEPERKWGPCVPGPKWSQLLLANGFKSVDLVLHDYPGPICREHSIIIASRDGSGCLPDAAPRRAPVTLLLGPGSHPQTAVAEGLRLSLEKQGETHCEIKSHIKNPSTRYPPNSTLVFLAELYQPYLSTLDEDSFRNLQDLLSKAKVVIWLAHSCRRSVSFPDTEMVKGLARVLCTENPSLRFVTLKFESSLLEAETCIQLASQVIMTTLRDSSSEACELEYIEREGVLMINRVYSSDQLNKEVHAKTHTLLTDRMIQHSPPLALKVPNPGLLDSLRWEADLSWLQSEDLVDYEIEIEVQAVGVNFRDLLVVLGKFNASTVGCECAGVVTRIGANCSSRLQPGDRVCAGVLGCARTRVRCHLDLAVKLPPFLSVEEAAALPITGVTAYYSLVTLANLQKEDSILIHSATGGTGQMALQLAQSIGAQIFVTVGTEEKRKLVKESFGIPDENIFHSRDTSFAKELLRRTDGRGVDLVLNSLSGRALLASWECVAPFGRFIELGKADIQANSKLPMSRFFGEVSFHAVAVDYILENRPALFQKQLQAVMNLLDEKKIKVASPLNIYSVSQIESAFRHMQSGRNTGKMVLTLSPSDAVPTWLPPSYSCHLDPNVSYLIAGGLGGLGRSAARWMAQRGARYLILLSRSGPRSSTAQTLIKELKEAGVIIRAPQCDVSDRDSLVAALDHCMDMPPIKGCLQGTMDSLFEFMTWDQWSRCIQSKVPSSWNLHANLPRDLSFFIMLSSAAGIVGSMGQSNYAAGNTYQDGLAAHRLALGEKALSIDLGWMGDVGIVAENANLTRGKEAIADLAPLFETEFLALLDRYCDPDSLQPPELSQVVIGLVTPAQFKAKELDPPDWLVDRPIFKGLSRDSNKEDSNGGAEGGSTRSDRNWAEELGRASSITEATNVVIEALRRKLSKATSISQEDIDTKQPLHVYGVDSLLAVEIRSWFAKTMKTEVAIFDITGQGSLEEVAQRAATQSSLVTDIVGVL